MAIHYKNPATGEYEVIKIPVMKGEQGHSGIHVGTDAPPTTDIKLWFDPSDTSNEADIANRLDSTLTACVDYMGNDRGSIKAAADANVDWLLGEINTAHYEGQRITATDTIEGHAKSALLKGQTLVNCNTGVNSIKFYINSKSNFVRSATLIHRANKTLIKPSTRYLLTFKVSELNLDGLSQMDLLVNNNTEDLLFPNAKNFTITANGLYKQIVTTNKSADFDNHTFLIKGSASQWEQTDSTSRAMTISDIMLIEYQEGMENWDIPYFEGMQSVQMPVLTTTGKNLLTELVLGDINSSSGLFVGGTTWKSTDFINVDNMNNIVFHSSIPFNIANFAFFKYDKNKNYLGYNGIYNSFDTASISLENNVKYVRFRVPSDVPTGANLQLEQGTVVTTYEPHRTNILTTSEEVVLRSLPNGVCDTLNVETGELTQHIGEITFDGTNKQWEVLEYPPHKNNTHYQFKYQLGEGVIGGGLWTNAQSILSNILPSANESLHWGGNGDYGIGGDGNSIMLTWKKDTCPFNDITTLNEWLKKNPLTVQYTLATPIIKTVDLSDNHVYSYKDVTHYDCSSAEGSLVPTLSVDVPTNLPAVVTRQRATIQELEVENETLTEQLENANRLREEGDIELLSQDFEFDFRLMEVEFALGLPSAYLSTRGKSTMARTPYEMAKSLIELGKYEYEDMKRKLDSYLDKKRMTQAEYDELIAMMETDQTPEETLPEGDEIESAEENVINPDHGIMTLPLD